MNKSKLLSDLQRAHREHVGFSDALVALGELLDAADRLHDLMAANMHMLLLPEYRTYVEIMKAIKDYEDKKGTTT